MIYRVPNMAVMPSRVTIDANPRYSLGGLREVRPVPYTVRKIAPIKTVGISNPEIKTISFG